MTNNLKRVFNFAVIDFYRNRVISVAAIFVLTITILLLTGLFFMHGVSNYLVSTIQNKIDITAYFKEDVPEQDILEVKSQILKISPDIKNVEYISKEEALNQFTKKHKDSTVFSKALTEVGDNPFLPSLNVTTSGNVALYQQVSNVLQQDQFNDLIEKIDFSQKKDTIEKVFSITSKINTFAIGLGIILILIAILVVFNTIRLVIDRSRDEISTMRIVGASSWFIRAPFVIEGALFGFVSFVICFVITISSVYSLSSGLSSIMPGFILFTYFADHFWTIIGMQLLSGAGLGALFSYIAVKKYLSI